eukprot:TRINITY_DN8249_c0_g6_i4.p1 TRINITY_DN8249_c0_g6~~TRINITY_DN8249_c0_g6_i4.p1  ORF type:complete len:479 (-),score=114.59 TRINITY_DN8249_c0_g6_i4:107-1342(-)
MYVFKIFGMDVLNISDPEICDYIENHTKEFDRGDWPWKIQMYVFGGVLLFAMGGKKWEEKRRVLNPCFGSIPQKDYIFPIIVNNTEKMITYLKEHQNTPIDVDQLAIGITMNTICNFCFGRDLDETDKNIILDAFSAILSEIDFIHAVPFYMYLVTPARLKKWDKDRRLKNIIYKFISNSKEGSLVEKLIEKGESREAIFSEVLTLLFSGHDSTAHTLTWCIYRMTQDPQIGSKVQQEIEKMNQVHKFNIVNDMEFANEFTYIKAIINETLRFYPQVTQHPVFALEDSEINGIPIKKGSCIITNQITVMRDPEYWDDPETYNPDRFLKNPPMRIPADKPQLTPAKLFKPFLLGPHVCIGKHLALSELQVFLPSVFNNFEIKLVNSKFVEPRQNFTLRPADPIIVTLKQINK